MNKQLVIVGAPRFLHYRSFDGKGKVESRSGATIAYVTNEDGTISWAAAFCHPRDNYCKRMGRVKASGHLKSPAYAETTDEKMTPEEFRAYIDKSMLNQQQYERKMKHVKKAA